jgi:hypothetical protein
MSLFQELLEGVDRMELAFSIADAELQTALCDYDGSNDADIRIAALKCEQAYNAVIASQVDVDIYLESYDLAGRS